MQMKTITSCITALWQVIGPSLFRMRARVCSRAQEKVTCALTGSGQTDGHLSDRNTYLVYVLIFLGSSWLPLGKTCSLPYSLSSFLYKLST